MSELEYIEKHSSYTVTPNDMHFLDDDFSIYNYVEIDGIICNDFESCTYDISFLEYLK